MMHPIHRPEYSLAETFERALSRWWIIVLLMILGGAIGWLFHFRNPPVYEAMAVITGSMHYEQRQLTQAEEDLAYANATTVVSSPSVTSQAFDDAEAQGLSFEDGRPQLFLEIRGSLWQLRVRAHDPQAAADFANLWAQRAYETLDQARQHAFRADQILSEIGALQSCLSSRTQTVEISPSMVFTACEHSTLDEIQTLINTLSAQLDEEKNLSLGILSILDFTLTDPASKPEAAVIYDRAKLTFAGASIGLIISLWVVNFRKVKRHA